MLHLVTGVPGASKTAFVVTELDKIERYNKVHLEKNKIIFQKNKSIFNTYRSDFSVYVYEVGSGHELKKVYENLPDDYFDMFEQDFDDLRPDDYFLRSTRYNEIMQNIIDTDNVKADLLLPVRTIYTNIKALKIDYVRANVYDWRTCPDGSVIVIDEVQLVEPYSELKVKHEIVQELTIHRHRGFDFYFITQAPSLLHPTVKELIGCHYHITRPYGGTPKVYQYGSTRPYPNALVNKLNYEQKFTFKPSPHIFKLYKSTTINTHKKRYPKALIGFGLFILSAFALFIYSVVGTVQNSGDLFDEKKEPAKTEKVYQASSASAPASSSISASEPVTSSAPVNSENNQNMVKYDITKPYDFDASQYQYEIKQTPILAGCAIDLKNQCNCYTQQMTIIKISKSDCKKYMSGDKPFNPFLNPFQEKENALFNPQNIEKDYQKDNPQSIKTYAMTNISDNAFSKELDN